jgi:hypothetical protein
MCLGTAAECPKTQLDLTFGAKNSNTRPGSAVLSWKEERRLTMATRNLGLAAGVALATLLGYSSHEVRAADDQGPGPARRPPQEAIDACANQTEGATCTVSFRGQSVQGKCVKGHDDQEPLACMPPRRPPQEAIDACANQQEGATCTMSFHGKTVQGACGKGPHGNETLACIPPPPPEAIEACAKLSEGAACTVWRNERNHEGTCRKPPSGSGPLACLPTRPHGP